MTTSTTDLETLAFEGIDIDFVFETDKPTFGDLFLIVGFENPNFIPDSREFEKLAHHGFTQIDDYFGIENDSDTGDDVKIWLYPIIKNQVVHHNQGPFDAIRLSYVVVRNDIKTANLLKETFQSLTDNLKVTATYNGAEISDYAEIQSLLDKIIEHCRSKLKVEPGSDEALMLDW